MMSDCFVIMPITTLSQHQSLYNDDSDHFTHVMDCLFCPAITAAGMNPISPKTKGSDIIHADIIKNLSTAELVLCDMSAMNPNVFYELGIRTALNKPVAIVTDDKTTHVPFDASIINHHRYDSGLRSWLLQEEIERLAAHLTETVKKSKNHNTMWKYFGVEMSGSFSPEEVTDADKLDVILQKLDQQKILETNSQQWVESAQLGDVDFNNADSIMRWRNLQKQIHKIASTIS